LQVDAIANRLTFAPRLPTAWKDLSVSRISLAGASISLKLHRTAHQLMLEIDNSGGVFKFEFAPELPLGATLRRTVFNHRAIPGAVENSSRETDASVALDLPHGKSELRLDYEGGIEVTADEPEPKPGDASEGIRIVDICIEKNALTIDADVPTARASLLQIHTAWKIAKADGVTLQPTADGVTGIVFAAAHDSTTAYRRARATLEIKR
jgi:hypothetical protein